MPCPQNDPKRLYTIFIYRKETKLIMSWKEFCDSLKNKYLSVRIRVECRQSNMRAILLIYILSYVYSSQFYFHFS